MSEIECTKSLSSELLESYENALQKLEDRLSTLDSKLIPFSYSAQPANSKECTDIQKEIPPFYTSLKRNNERFLYAIDYLEDIIDRLRN